MKKRNHSGLINPHLVKSWSNISQKLEKKLLVIKLKNSFTELLFSESNSKFLMGNVILVFPEKTESFRADLPELVKKLVISGLS